MGVSNILKVALQLVMLPVMARLLGPGEFGLYALALPTVTFLQMLADGGLGSSLSRESESSEQVWSTAFWVLHCVCALLTIAVICWSFVLAHITHQPRLPAIMSALSLSLMLLASSILPGARLLRRARMAIGAVSDFVANLIGSAIGVGFALHHAGAWSLVAQYLSTFAVKTLVVNIAAPRLPSFQLSLRLLMPHLMVGGAIAGVKLSDFIGKIAEGALLSRSLGAAMLGAYTFGNQVPRFVCEAISNPSWASLYVQAIRQEREKVLALYYNMTRILGILLLPATILAAVVAPKIVPLLMGRSWLAVIPVISIILPSYAIMAIGGQSSALLYAYGRSDISLWIATGSAGGRVMAVALAPFVGLEGVAIGIAVANVLSGFASIVVPAKAIGSSPIKVFRSLAGSFICASVGALLYCMLMIIHAENILWSSFAMGSSAISCLLLLTMFEAKRLRDDFALIRRILKAD